MRVKRFQARTLPDAVAMVKAELGPNAVILTTQAVKVGGVFGLFGQRKVEVMAAVDDEPPMRAPGVTAAHGPAQGGNPSQAAQAVLAQAAAALGQAAPEAQAQRMAPAVKSAMAGGQPGAVDTVQAEMAAMRALLLEIGDRVGAAGSKFEPELEEVLARLAQVGVQEQAALHLMNRVQAHIIKHGNNWDQAWRVARELMERDLGPASDIDQASGNRVIALIGPTGVGKTTTLAKLAAYYALSKGLSVSLITADTYRVSAVEQLRTYAEILGLPLEVVYDPAEMAGALARQRHRDIVLVDTAGRSPRNAAHMGELQELLKVLKPDNSYLVMSVTTGYRDATHIVDQYLPIGFERFLFTKWDESSTPGLVYSIAQRYRKPLSYITTGQNVPDDIELADPSAITRALLGD